MIEHKHAGDPYSHEGMWYYYEATHDYVATATWSENVKMNGPFDGPSNHRKLIRILHAEDDSVDNIRDWCREQLTNGASSANIYRTWKISSVKRDNTFFEKIS